MAAHQDPPLGINAQQPTLLFVHGGFHGSWAWDRLRDELAEYRTSAVDLPSSGSDIQQLGGFGDDVDAICGTVKAIGGPVVVVAHSYGGAPTTQAACTLPDVARVIYVAANVPDVGQTASSFLEFAGDSQWWLDIRFDDGYMDAVSAADVFYHDVAPAITAQLVPRLTHQSLASGIQVLTDAAWRHLPTCYVVCDRDRAFPVEIQSVMAQRTNRTYHIDCGHSPFLARPSELADLIRAELGVPVTERRGMR
jgi:pimeloyl-ACP methyl ester carboxylesterase